MNLLNKLTSMITEGKITVDNSRKEELKSRLNTVMECNEDRTTTKDHVNPQEYMELLIKYKSSPEEYDLKAYSAEIDAIDAAMAEVKHTETVQRLKNVLLKK